MLCMCVCVQVVCAYTLSSLFCNTLNNIEMKVFFYSNHSSEL
uniref:Uncharacterized protein n=1 Tax=Anguilla anguilla TaxID=7936 RepID=A0A0E9VWE5_ANGAN